MSKTLMLCLMVGILAQHTSADSLKEAEMKIAALENYMDKFSKETGDIETTSANVADKLRNYQLSEVPFIEQQTIAQNELIETFFRQAKALQDRVNAVNVMGAETSTRASKTGIELTKLLERVEEAKAFNNVQTLGLETLETDVEEGEDELKDTLQATVAELVSRLSDVSGSLDNLEEQVKDKRCEYGSIFVGEGNTDLEFSKPFGTVPKVSLFLMKNSAELDLSNGGNSSVSFDIDVTNVSTDSFTIVKEVTSTAAGIEKIGLTWMACEF